MAREREHLGTLVLLGAQAAPPGGAVPQDQRRIGVGLHVVDVRRFGKDAGLRGVGRLDLGHTAPVLERAEEAGLVAADVAAGAAHDLQLEVEADAQDVFAGETPLVRLLDGLLHARHRERVLVADVDVALVGLAGDAGDDHAFDDRVGVALHRVAVDEGAGVALVGVADDVLRMAVGSAEEVPLAAGGEGGAAAAPEPGGFHLLDDRLGAHLDRLGQRFVAAAGDVVVDVLGIDDAAVGHQAAHLTAPEGQRREGRDAAGRPVAGHRERHVGGRTFAGNRRINKRGHLVWRDVLVENCRLARLQHLEDGFGVAESHAAGEHDVRIETTLGYRLPQRRQRLDGADYARAGAHADADERARRLGDGRPDRVGRLAELAIRGHRSPRNNGPGNREQEDGFVGALFLVACSWFPASLARLRRGVPIGRDRSARALGLGAGTLTARCLARLFGGGGQVAAAGGLAAGRLLPFGRDVGCGGRDALLESARPLDRPARVQRADVGAAVADEGGEVAGAVALDEAQLELAVDARLVDETAERGLKRAADAGGVLEEAGGTAAPLDDLLSRRLQAHLGVEVDGAEDDGGGGVEHPGEERHRLARDIAVLVLDAVKGAEEVDVIGVEVGDQFGDAGDDLGAPRNGSDGREAGVVACVSEQRSVCLQRRAIVPTVTHDKRVSGVGQFAMIASRL